MRLAVGGATDTGTVRDNNQDTIFIGDPETDIAQINGLLLAVADGMGGYQHGEIASQIAIETLRDEFYGSEVAEAEIPQRLKRAYRLANERIFADGASRGPDHLMGTTLVAAVIRGNALTVANVGDSRAYLIRANRLNQISTDHSLVAEQVAAGTMTQDEARQSHHRHIITRALGQHERVDVDIFELRLLADDRLIIASDGVSDYLKETDISQAVIGVDPEEAARKLVSSAIEHASSDNVSAIVAWMAPTRVLAQPEPVVSSRSEYLMPALAMIGLIVFVALIVLLLLVGH